MYAFDEKTLNRDGCDIHYWISTHTNGTHWLLFLHGAGADHRMFSDQLPAIYDKYHLMLWDARGHGLSRPMENGFSIKRCVDDLLGIMAREKIDKATLIGQSMGGNIAQEVVFLYPDKVENLVLIDCTCNTMKLSRMDQFLINITPLLLPFYPWKYMLDQSARVSSLKPEVQSYLKEVFGIVGRKDFNSIFLATAACLHYEKDYAINKPMLLVCGEQDGTGNIRKIAPLWLSREPKCEFHSIQDAGHCSNQDNPGEFNSILTDFLSRHSVCESAAGGLI